MSDDWKREMELLYQLFEREVSSYQQLIREIKIESKYLREGKTEALMQSVRSIEGQIKILHLLEQEIQKTAETILQGLGKGERERTLSHLLLLLPPVHQSRLSSYQQTVLRLKEWVRQINDQNMTFIKEYMSVLNELISPLIGRISESAGYPGHKRSPTFLSYALNREI